MRNDDDVYLIRQTLYVRIATMQSPTEPCRCSSVQMQNVVLRFVGHAQTDYACLPFVSISISVKCVHENKDVRAEFIAPRFGARAEWDGVCVIYFDDVVYERRTTSIVGRFYDNALSLFMAQSTTSGPNKLSFDFIVRHSVDSKKQQTESYRMKFRSSFCSFVCSFLDFQVRYC